MVFPLILLLTSPILVSFYYSNTRDIIWLVLSITALVIIFFVLTRAIKGITNKLTRQILGVSVIALIAVYELSRLASFYFQGESFNERFFFHFNWNSVTEAGNAYQATLVITVIYLFIVIFLSWVGFRHNNQDQNPPFIVLSFLIFAAFFLEPDLSKLSIRQIQTMLTTDENLTTDSIAWNELALNPASLSSEIGPVTPGKNLVFIYLESLEAIYTDEQIFPGLTPYLNRLKQSGLVFENMQQTEGTGWTIAGIVASQCGTPLLYNAVSKSNDILQSGFLNQAICLGDILQQAGYYQIYLGGASKEFAGKGSFLIAHGYDEVFGKAELTGQLDSNTAFSGWGLYDDALFAIAEEKFNLLAQSNQPFNLTLLTLDTHHPNGHASSSCPAYKTDENTMLNAVHCTDFLLNQFITSIRQHPAGENTLIVLFSDHLAMRNVAQPYFPENYKRLLLFIILDTTTKKDITVVGTHMDIAPTILHLMDIQHQREFLAGENLIAREQRGATDMFSSTQRLDTIRHINRHIFTQIDHDPCASEYLVDVQENTIKIGNHIIAMHLAGHPLHPKTLNSSHGLLIALNDNGKIEHTVTFNLENLRHIIYQHEKTPFLLIAKADYLPEFIKTEITPEQHNNIAVLWKNTHGKINYLGSSNDSAHLKIKHSGCIIQSLKNSPKKEKTIDSLGLSDICQNNHYEKNYIDTETGDIHLTKIAYENLWYHALLSKSDADRYHIADLTLLEEIMPDPQSNSCHAYFGHAELIIPALKSGKQTYAVKMQFVPETDGQFRILEKAN